MSDPSALDELFRRGSVDIPDDVWERARLELRQQRELSACLVEWQTRHSALCFAIAKAGNQIPIPGFSTAAAPTAGKPLALQEPWASKIAAAPKAAETRAVDGELLPCGHYPESLVLSSRRPTVCPRCCHDWSTEVWTCRVCDDDAASAELVLEEVERVGALMATICFDMRRDWECAIAALRVIVERRKR